MHWYDWTHLAQDRDQLWAPMKVVMNFRFHKMFGNFLVAQ
jgi:hypothetical protein